MNPRYLVPRVVRHFLPERLVRFLLLRSMIIRPGLETVNAVAAVNRYSEALSSEHWSVEGKRILVFGYGGRFDVGIGLLEAGASYVGLCDKYAAPDDGHNQGLVSSHPSYLQLEGTKPRPRRQHMELIQADLANLAPPDLQKRYDLVISNSVYEHLEDPDGITSALARWSAPGGLQLHFIDLRDHFFKYPFEMLCYKESTWRRWLNPSSNHNRLRIWDYRRIFEKSFKEVQIATLERDEPAFTKIRHRIRKEFLSGVLAEDAVTLIRITARGPRYQVSNG